jgi:hypothetical protein
MTTLYTQILEAIEVMSDDTEITTSEFLHTTNHRASINKVLHRMEGQGILELSQNNDYKGGSKVWRKRVEGRYSGFVPLAITEGVFAHLWARPAPVVGGRIHRGLVEED